MTLNIEKKFEEYREKLERIIKKEVPLRDPAITIVKISVEYVKEVFEKHILLFNKLKNVYPNWTYKIINIEKIFFMLLKKRKYIEWKEFARTMERKGFSKKIQRSIITDLVGEVEKVINELKNSKYSDKYPPFLLILNMHSTYPYIETGDVISRIINEKGVYIIILYIYRKKYKKDEPEPYKHANYMVQSQTLI
ncbi:MAG: hypothetical protein ACTSRA_19025 [Promethearchaeota archaeon]